VAFLDRQVAELRVHLAVLVGLAFDRQLQRARRGQLLLRVQQVEVAERVLHFLVGGRLEVARGLLVAGGASHLREVAVLDVGHRLAGERGFEVLDGDRLLVHVAAPWDAVDDGGSLKAGLKSIQRIKMINMIEKTDNSAGFPSPSLTSASALPSLRQLSYLV